MPQLVPYRNKNLIELASRMTPHRRAFEAMGFTLDKIEIEDSHMAFAMILRARFTCACGRVEYFQQVIDDVALEHMSHGLIERELDVARKIIAFGSTSPEHLRADGFSEAEIDEIQRKGKAALAAMQSDDEFRLKTSGTKVVSFPTWDRP